jgi:hypothetical protein
VDSTLSGDVAAPLTDGDDASFLAAIVGDGRPLLAVFAVGLGVAGAFAWFLSLAGEALPHELRFLGLRLDELRALADGRVMDFMVHDRVAFGGTLLAMAVLSLWLVAVPLGRREPWAWWLIVLTSAFGFASFLAYAGSGYIDGWHATASVGLLAAFVPGSVLTWRTLDRTTARPRPAWPSWRTLDGLGRRLIALTGAGLVLAGLTILTLGTIVVFVPQDLIYIGFARADLDALNPHLVPLIAHDRTGFGGGVATMGFLVLGCLGWARWSRSLWQALAVAGVFGFGAAIGIHGLVGYLDSSHVGPAVAGAFVFALGMVLSRPSDRAPAAAPARALAAPAEARAPARPASH